MTDDNLMLAETQAEWREFGAHLYPAVQINGVKFKGQVNPENVFEALCFGYIEMPKGCRTFLKKEGIVLRTGGISTTELFTIIGILLTINGIIFIFYKKHLKQELNSEMKMQVSSAVS